MTDPTIVAARTVVFQHSGLRLTVELGSGSQARMLQEAFVQLAHAVASSGRQDILERNGFYWERVGSAR